MFFAHLMCSRESRNWISKMASAATLMFFLLLILATAAGGEVKKSVDKIIIHVPYKIHKHHHTHTKYKVITISAPKKENTVIYLKEQVQPVIKEVPVGHPQVGVSETQLLPGTHEASHQAPKMIIPPHQEASQAFLESIIDQNNKMADQQKEYSTIPDDQKPLESHSGHGVDNLTPNLSYKPMLQPPQTNLIHDHPFTPHQAFTPSSFMNPAFHQSFLPKLSYQPMLPPPYKFKAFHRHHQPLHDNVAHASSQVYRTILPGPKAPSYEVREESQEGKALHEPTVNAIPVPSKKTRRKGKTYALLGHNYELKNMNKLLYDPNYEYEHVGYLIIDGNSRKLVGKNMKDRLVLSR